MKIIITPEENIKEITNSLPINYSIYSELDYCKKHTPNYFIIDTNNHLIKELQEEFPSVLYNDYKLQNGYYAGKTIKQLKKLNKSYFQWFINLYPYKIDDRVYKE